MAEIQQGYFVDGKMFATKAEAQEYANRDKVTEALDTICNGNNELNGWLVENKRDVLSALDVGTIRRVKQTEKNKLVKALKAITEAGNPAFNFVVENQGAIIDSFRWPKTERLNTNEKELAKKNSLMLITDNNGDLVEWILEHEAEIVKAYDAGKPVRPISPNALSALERYRETKRQEKEAAEAAAEDAAE